MQRSGQYILLPRARFIAESGPAFDTLVRLPHPTSNESPITALLNIAGVREVQVIDSIAENGPRLVEMDVEAAAALNSIRGPLRVEPVVEYGHPNPRLQPQVGNNTNSPIQTTSIILTVTDAVTSSGISDITVVAFTNFAAREGDQGITDSSGQVSLNLTGSTIERLYCYPCPNYWGAFGNQLSIQPWMSISVEPIDCIQHYYKNSQFDSSTGVKVGIIDTGVGPHHDLNVVRGINTVTGESPLDYFDCDIHGTHVAGLVGADNSLNSGLRGLAPGVPLYVYRVFGKNANGATNFAILKAMILAETDCCDVINLSLGGGPYDAIVSEAITAARNNGMLVVVAAGNDGRKAVNYPAAYSGALAVSAMGREGTFPTGSLEEADVLRPPISSIDTNEFIAEFSNAGHQIAVTGPGVGAVSTLPNNNYGPLSGTSMAAPVITGAVACLLSRNATINAMARDRARSDTIEKLLLSNCIRRGFGLTYEGYGLPDPTVI
jgi:subtilisin